MIVYHGMLHLDSFVRHLFLHANSDSLLVLLPKAKYEEAHGMSLHKAISKEFRGDLKTVLQVR